ncbi:hypothetical protein LARV_02835 [Longilinea arvoryzae]|uniref:Uncharacterized protein n=1 Tax=Longilinea arvoryzae TaxID=360412 RepID=A0A0S7BBA9_9CHLR|nr:hypothetical protein [Longilinea arvoryzae]GAP15055.1 hypothetical protein LARV_02835 [Longilinea arvoryzae]
MSISESDKPIFAGPIEETFAKILDFYGIEWVYEPSSFPLVRDEQGRVVEAFTPDFYLPQQNLYIELTTLRPHLATYKNRRMRLMRELYPEIHIKLLKRRELRDMMIKYGLAEEAIPIMGTKAQQRVP